MPNQGGFRNPKTHGQKEPAWVPLNVNLIPPLEPPEALAQFAASVFVDARPYCMEALRRGASGFELTRLMIAWHQRAVKIRSNLSPPRPSLRPRLLDTPLEFDTSAYDFDALSDVIADCVKAYEDAVQVELESLGEDVQLSFSFGFEPPRKASHDEIAAERTIYERSYYRTLRAAYYCAGYRDPAETIFRQIHPHKILGRPVAGGLHQLFIDKIQGIDALLESWGTGLAAETGAAIRSIGGFVPRYQAGTKVLSNHAFGLAIDLDPVVNPDINNREEIAAIKEITGYDLGKELVEFEPGITPLDRVAQIHARMQDASDKLKSWLNANVQSKARSASTEEGAADEKAEKLMGTLLKHRKAADINAWQRRGIQTIPVTFAAAMARLGFRWGAQYEKKKDVMHFELVGALERSPTVTLEEMSDPVFDLYSSTKQRPNASRVRER
jgi:hypothetical protein